MIKVNDDQFEAEVMQSDILTVVDFGAEWCGPCKKLHPIMDEIGAELDGKVKILEMDVATSPQTALRFGVTSVPQLLFFKGGEIKGTVIGLLPKTKILEKIEDYL